MPRHPPCALNNEHTNHHTQTKCAGGHTSELDKINTKKKSHKHTQHTTQKRSLPHVFNARVHYTVLTQHPNHKPAHTNHAHQQNGQAPQKGDNAPDTQQCTNIQTLTSHVHNTACHKAPFKHSVFVLKVYLPPGNFQTNNVGSMTLAHSTNTHHNRGSKGTTVPNK